MKRPHNINEIDLFVAERLRDMRKAQKMSMKTLATYLNKTWQQIGKYEKGENRIAAGTLWQIADLLGCSISDFFPDTAILSRDFTKEDRKNALIRAKKIDERFN